MKFLKRNGQWPLAVQLNIRVRLPNLVCTARVEENKRIVRTLLKDMSLSQINLIDLSLGISNGGHIGPLHNPKIHDDARNQGRTLNRTHHLKLRQPLSNHSLNRGDLDPSDCDIVDAPYNKNSTTSGSRGLYDKFHERFYYY
jgi:hypothetical protein